MTASGKRKVLARDLPPVLQIERADGCRVIDSRGRTYVDFVMGWCVGNLGWKHPLLASRPVRFKGPDYVYPGFGYRPWVELATLLVSIAPGRLTTCFRATGGSEAVDIALQAAQVHTGRRGFLSLEGSYHGNTLAGMSVGSSEYRDRCRNLLPRCGKIRPPLNAKTLDRIERRLKRRDVAAFIMEPISINLGVLIPEKGFMTALQRACRRYGTLLVADEVATGFGRTGRMFACDHFDLEPDLLCVAKAMSGGVAGIGAVIATPEVAKSMEDKEGAFYSTYGWHPRSTDVAIAAVRHLRKNAKELMAQVAETSEYFRARLLSMDFGTPATLRIQGLAIGIDVGDDDRSDEIKSKCRRRGLLISNEDSTLLLLPALTIDRATAAKGLDILERCI